MTPTLISAVSRKASTDLPLNITGGITVEPRQNGPTQLVLTFGANVVKGPSFAVSLSSSTGGADGAVSSTSVSGTTLTINLSGAIDAQTLVVSISDLRNTSTSASGAYTLNLGVLLADANQDRSVNALDFNTLASNFGGAGKTYSQGDLNSDGTVDTSDFVLFAGEFGKTLAATGAAPLMENKSLFSRSPVPDSLIDVLN